MADDGDGRGGAADTSGGGQGTTEELDPGPSLVGMLFNFCVLVVIVAICYGIYRRWFRRLIGADAAQGSEALSLPKMRRRDFGLDQLGEYDGVQNPRILMAVNMKVFDVTTGKKFYGRGKDFYTVQSNFFQPLNSHTDPSQRQH